jgi:maleamate amidohydrolase
VSETDVYQRQGFGNALDLSPPYGLLLIDFVNGFADPASFGGGNIGTAVARSRELLALAREAGWPVAHTRIVFAADAANSNIFAEKVPSLLSLTEDSFGSQIVDQLTPEPGEYVVRKTNPSAFSGTDLQAWLTARAVRTLVIGGCVTSGCVRASVVDAMCLGFRPLVVEDCVGDRALAPHDANLFDIRQKYAEVLPLDTVRSRLLQP